MAKKKTATDNSRSEQEQVANRMAGMIWNQMVSRSNLLRKFLDSRRDIDDECGYPKTNELSAEHYQMLYDRESIATRVVEVLPRECWKVEPEVYEVEDAEQTTAFEEAWSRLDEQLTRGEESHYQDEQGSPIWELLERADVLSGIGHYGVVVLGLDDGDDLERPAAFRDGTQLVYAQAYSEWLTDVVQFDDDRRSRRFGLPVMYSITLNDPNQTYGGLGVPSDTMRVHWSRVVHVVDGRQSSDVWGVPRMRPVYNRLYDLRKLYGGSAEMYWQGAFPGLSIETHPQLGGEVTLDATTIRDRMQDFMHGLQRYFAIEGAQVKSLAPQVVDPASHIDSELEAICVVLGIPKRVFMGSERGELASTQDHDAWNQRLAKRQNRYLTPMLIVPFVNRLVNLGVLPRPAGFSVRWPSMDEINEKEMAEIAELKTKAMQDYVASGVDMLMEPISWLTKVLGYTTEEAVEIHEATADYAAEERERKAEEAEAQEEEDDDIELTVEVGDADSAAQ